MYRVYRVESGEFYQYCETERGAKMLVTRLNKQSDYLRQQGIYKNISTFAYKLVEEAK